MGSLCEDEDQFFDSKECITPVSDSGSGSDGSDGSDVDSRVFDSLVRSFGYDVWVRSPGTIRERREKLFRLMGLAPNHGMSDGVECCLEGNEEVVDSDRVLDRSGAVLRSSFRDVRLSNSSQSSLSVCSSDTQEMLEMALEESLVNRIRNLDDGSEFIVDELGQDGLWRRLREVGSNRLVSGEEFERILGLSPLVQRVMRRDVGVGQTYKDLNRKQRVKRGWLRKLGIVACVADNEMGINRVKAHDGSAQGPRGRTRNVRVRTYKKQSKEFSALYTGQDLNAHEGAILTMKFSLDGRFLASAGEDGIVRIWEVIESDQPDLINIPDVDSSHVYFSMNHMGELVPVNVDKEKRGRFRILRKSSEAACVIIPRKVFQLGERPLHELSGHQGEVLDLSWSNEKHLLSSSVDKTVRLWRVGVDQCLKVFCHNTYVTGIQFNPADENYFISGSVDGKVRIWDIPECLVADWADIKDTVTAICYRPDGKGAIVGSMTGDCYFYDISDNRLRLKDKMSSHGKKKTAFGRVTGFQFSPGDPSKLMVTTADSQIRILKGVNVICKYKGLRNTGSQISASFTSNGTHIVSASEDSSVYVWDCANTDRPVPSHVPSNRSCERFFSINASVAVPWCGKTCSDVLASSSMKHSGITVRYATEGGGGGGGAERHNQGGHFHTRAPLFSTDAISLGFSDPFCRGVATWPEEELTDSNSLVVSSTTCKSEYKFLKTTCQNMAGTPHAWGLVIVTATWDGRIRVFQNYGLPVRL